MLINAAKVYIDLSFLFVHMHRLNVQNNDHLYSGLWWLMVVSSSFWWFLVVYVGLCCIIVLYWSTVR